jgi:acetyl esterase/lipase
MTALLDPFVFKSASIPEDLRQLNARIITEMATYPDPWTFPPSVIREARKQGKGIFPQQKLLPDAEILSITGTHGEIGLRILRPKSKARGVYMHFHSGGHMLGTNDMQDEELERIVKNCGLAVVSVDYHLAPEYPYPAGPDDCEAAALWLARGAKENFGVEKLLIGGESAGAHLATIALLRLRDKHGLMPFLAANLNAGCYDLSLTPSVRNWGAERLIVTTRDIKNFAAAFISKDYDLRDPDISPLYATLQGLPPALFTVGTRDPLLDDTLFMANRWQAAGNKTELAVYPGGCHVFQRFFTPSGIACMERQEKFLQENLI